VKQGLAKALEKRSANK